MKLMKNVDPTIYVMRDVRGFCNTSTGIKMSEMLVRQ